MPQFVFISSGVTNVQFEKAMEIKIKSDGKVSFVPQQSNSHGVGTGSMSSSKASQQAKEETLDSVRFEWTEAGAEFGAEIVKALAHQHNPPEPAA